MKHLNKFRYLYLLRYFGLQYTDSLGTESWLNLDKKVQDQKVKKEATLQFKFRVRYYPENVVDEIIQGSTLRLLYLQVICKFKLV